MLNEHSHQELLGFFLLPFLALPGDREIGLIETGTWNQKMQLKATHRSSVHLMAFSPNGNYLVTADAHELLVRLTFLLFLFS